MRQGEMHLEFIEAVKKENQDVKSAFTWARAKITYDRSSLIKEAINTLGENIFEELSSYAW